MDAVTKALSEIRFRIPSQILRLVFTPNGERFMDAPGAVEYAIRSKVIDARVRVDVDLVGAAEMDIPLQDQWQEYTENPNVEQYDRFSYIYRVPKQVTGGRQITSALAYSYGYNASMGIGAYQAPNPYQTSGCGNSAVLDAATQVSMAMTPISINQTAFCSIIGENVVLIEGYIPLPRTSFLRCLLTHDSEFSTIVPQAYGRFADLCVLATQAYIYNEYYIRLGQGFLYGGQELPQIKELVDSYRESDQIYRETIATTWRKVSHLQDPQRKHRLIKMLVGGKG